MLFQEIPLKAGLIGMTLVALRMDIGKMVDMNLA
jgi:hypothetical protein